MAETSTSQHKTLTTEKHPCPSVGFETAISAGEWPQTDALDRAATGTGNNNAHYWQKPRHEETGLTLRLLMSYIYGAPSKARNANVVYIWTYVWQR